MEIWCEKNNLWTKWKYFLSRVKLAYSTHPQQSDEKERCEENVYEKHCHQNRVEENHWCWKKSSEKKVGSRRWWVCWVSSHLITLIRTRIRWWWRKKNVFHGEKWKTQSKSKISIDCDLNTIALRWDENLGDSNWTLNSNTIRNLYPFHTRWIDFTYISHCHAESGQVGQKSDCNTNSCSTQHEIHLNPWYQGIEFRDLATWTEAASTQKVHRKRRSWHLAGVESNNRTLMWWAADRFWISIVSSFCILNETTSPTRTDNRKIKKSTGGMLLLTVLKGS